MTSPITTTHISLGSTSQARLSILPKDTNTLALTGLELTTFRLWGLLCSARPQFLALFWRTFWLLNVSGYLWVPFIECLDVDKLCLSIGSLHYTIMFTSCYKVDVFTKLELTIPVQSKPTLSVLKCVFLSGLHHPPQKNWSFIRQSSPF